MAFHISMIFGSSSFSLYIEREKKRNQKPPKSLLIDPETVPEAKKRQTEAR